MCRSSEADASLRGRAAVLVSFVVIALLLGSALTSDGDVTSNPESKQAEALIHEGFPPEPTPSEIVVVRSDRYTVDDPAFKAKVQRARRARRGRSVSSRTRRATTRTKDESLVSKDRHATMVPIVTRGDEVAPARRPGAVGERPGRFPGLDHRHADGRRRLREALRGGPAEGRAADRAAGGADHPRARVRGGRGGPRAGAARPALDRDRGRTDCARRPGVRGLVLRREHDLGDGARARDRLRALHPLAVPGRARARAREDRRDRRLRGDGEPSCSLQRHGLRARDVRDAAGARHGPAQSRAGRDPRRHRLGARGADAAARSSEPARRPGQRAADPGDRPAGDQQRRLGEPLLVGARRRRHAAPAREPRGGDGASARRSRSRALDRHGTVGAEHAARPLPVQARLRRAEPRLPRHRRRPGADRRSGRRLLGAGSVGDRTAQGEPCRRGCVRRSDADQLEGR